MSAHTPYIELRHVQNIAIKICDPRESL